MGREPARCAASQPAVPQPPVSAKTAFNHSKPTHRPVAALRSWLTPAVFCLVCPVQPRAPYHPPSSPRRKPHEITIAPQLDEQVPLSPAPSTISTSSSVALTHSELHLSFTAISITTPTQP
jgi:hypothetical protein